MMPYILLILGLLLIFIEFYLPGAVMGITGGLMVFASMILFAMQSESTWVTAVFMFRFVMLPMLRLRFILGMVLRT